MAMITRLILVIFGLLLQGHQANGYSAREDAYKHKLKSGRHQLDTKSHRMAHEPAWRRPVLENSPSSQPEVSDSVYVPPQPQWMPYQPPQYSSGPGYPPQPPKPPKLSWYVHESSENPVYQPPQSPDQPLPQQHPHSPDMPSYPSQHRQPPEMANPPSYMTWQPQQMDYTRHPKVPAHPPQQEYQRLPVYPPVQQYQPPFPPKASGFPPQEPKEPEMSAGYPSHHYGVPSYMQQKPQVPKMTSHTPQQTGSVPQPESMFYHPQPAQYSSVSDYQTQHQKTPSFLPPQSKEPEYPKQMSSYPPAQPQEPKHPTTPVYPYPKVPSYTPQQPESPAYPSQQQWAGMGNDPAPQFWQKPAPEVPHQPQTQSNPPVLKQQQQPQQHGFMPVQKQQQPRYSPKRHQQQNFVPQRPNPSYQAKRPHYQNKWQKSN